MEKFDLDKLRQEIDQIDCKIFQLLEKRFVAVKKIGKYKKINSLPIRNVEREKAIIDAKIKSTALQPKFIKKFYEIIFKHSYEIEK